MAKKRSEEITYKKHVKPLTEGQEEYIRAICENDIIICTGPAGSGKTNIAVGMAAQYLREDRIKKIVISRPVIEEKGAGIGFLPGTLKEKMQPYLQPIYDELSCYMSNSEIVTYENGKQLEIVPLMYMRGRTFKDSFVIVDEASNCTKQELKKILTRIGLGSKIILNGDIKQCDLSHDLRGGLLSLIERFEGINGIGICELHSQDIVRHPIIKSILEKLKDW